MSLKSHTIEFCENLLAFMKFTIANKDYPEGYLSYPCSYYTNLDIIPISTLRKHVFIHKLLWHYITWTHHEEIDGECQTITSNQPSTEVNDISRLVRVAFEQHNILKVDDLIVFLHINLILNIHGGIRWQNLTFRDSVSGGGVYMVEFYHLSPSVVVFYHL